MPCCWPLTKTGPAINKVRVVIPLHHNWREPTSHVVTLITDTYNEWLQDCADCSTLTAVNQEHIGPKPYKIPHTHSINRPRLQSEPCSVTTYVMMFHFYEAAKPEELCLQNSECFKIKSSRYKSQIL